jgi:hypothetical protein
MTHATASKWRRKRTAESRLVESALKAAGFEKVDAYRYNAASIRVRVIDRRFKEMNVSKRDEMVEPILAKLPESIQSDIVNLYTFSPEEVQNPKNRSYYLNSEFEDPSPSVL